MTDQHPIIPRPADQRSGALVRIWQEYRRRLDELPAASPEQDPHDVFHPVSWLLDHLTGLMELPHYDPALMESTIRLVRKERDEAPPAPPEVTPPLTLSEALAKDIEQEALRAGWGPSPAGPVLLLDGLPSPELRTKLQSFMQELANGRRQQIMMAHEAIGQALPEPPATATTALEHTGFAADWCDICGACTCKRTDDVAEPTDEQLVSLCEELCRYVDSTCPLHGNDSTHEQPDQEPTMVAELHELAASAWQTLRDQAPQGSEARKEANDVLGQLLEGGRLWQPVPIPLSAAEANVEIQRLVLILQPLHQLARDIGRFAEGEGEAALFFDYASRARKRLTEGGDLWWLGDGPEPDERDERLKQIRWCRCGQPWIPAAGLYGTTEEQACPGCVTRAMAKRLTEERDQLRRERNIAASAAVNGTWHWSDSDDNHLESLCEDALVTMTAGQLRSMTAAWIDASERKPDAGTEVLVLTPRGNRRVATYSEHGDEHWIRDDGDSERHFRPTHWAPLPELPPCTEHRCYHPDGCSSCGPGTA